MIPFGISGKYSLASLAVMFTKTKTVPVPDFFEDTTMMNHIAGAERYFPIIYKTELLQKLFLVSGVIWISVLALLAAAWVLAYIFSIREIKDARYLRDNVFLSDKTDTPAVFGIVRPKIVIPEKSKNDDLKYILLHENIHIKRKDNLVRIIAISVTSLHWFNPLAWIFLKAVLADIELACDEGVLSRLPRAERKEYAISLIGYKEEKNVLHSAFFGAKLKVRVENILSYRKISSITLLLMIVFFFVLAYVLLTNPK